MHKIINLALIIVSLTIAACVSVPEISRFKFEDRSYDGMVAASFDEFYYGYKPLMRSPNTTYFSAISADIQRQNGRQYEDKFFWIDDSEYVVMSIRKMHDASENDYLLLLEPAVKTTYYRYPALIACYNCAPALHQNWHSISQNPVVFRKLTTMAEIQRETGVTFEPFYFDVMLFMADGSRVSQ